MSSKLEKVQDLRAPLVYGSACGRPTTCYSRMRLATHLFFHPSSPRMKYRSANFAWCSLRFRDAVLFLVISNLILTLFGVLPWHINAEVLQAVMDFNTGIIIPVSCIVFTVEYLGRIWSIPESAPDEIPCKVRLLWAVHVLPLLELFAVVMMWVSVGQMMVGRDSPEQANTAAVARAARVVRIVSKANRAVKAAKTAQAAVKATQAATKATQSAVVAGSTLLAVETGRTIATKGPFKRSRSTDFVDHCRNAISPTMKDWLEKSMDVNSGDEGENKEDEADSEKDEESVSEKPTGTAAGAA